MKVKIKLLKSFAGKDEGEILEVTPNEAEQAIKAGNAEYTDVQDVSQWVKFEKEWFGNPKDSVIYLENKETAEALIKDGTAIYTDDPSADVWTKSLAEAIELQSKQNEATITKRIDDLADQFSSTVKKRFTVAANAIDHSKERMGNFDHIGHFYKAVYEAACPGGSVDKRLLEIKAPSGLNTIRGSEGGFPVPVTISERIEEIVFNEGGLLGRTDSEAISGNSITLNAIDETSRVTGSRRGGVRGYWMHEADQYTKSKPSFRQITLKPHKLGVFYHATDEELADTSGSSLEQKLTQYAGEEIRWLVDEAIVNGTGAGQPLGITTSAAAVEVAAEGSQTAETIVYPNVAKMFQRLLPQSQLRSIWLVNTDTLQSLMQMTWPDASGTQPVFFGVHDRATDQFAIGTMLGRPVVVIEQCETLGTVNDIILVDLGMYKTATRGAVRSAMSIHLRFDYGETAFRFDFRVDGMPWLNSAVTPTNGTDTLTSIVTLATRA